MFRIFPVYWMFIAVAAVLGLIDTRLEVASLLLFFRNFFELGRDTQHLWSLSVEEHFYLFWPGLLVLLGVVRGRHAAALLALGFGMWRLIESQAGWHLFPQAPPHLRTDLRMDALLWGAVVAFTLHEAADREKLRRQLQFWPWLGLLALCLVCIRFYSQLTSMVVAVTIPVILAGTVLHPEWLLSCVLDSAPVAWFGRISYSVYIWQQLFLDPGGASQVPLAAVSVEPACDPCRCVRELLLGREAGAEDWTECRREVSTSREAAGGIDRQRSCVACGEQRHRAVVMRRAANIERTIVEQRADRGERELPYRRVRLIAADQIQQQRRDQGTGHHQSQAPHRPQRS